MSTPTDEKEKATETAWQKFVREHGPAGEQTEHGYHQHVPVEFKPDQCRICGFDTSNSFALRISTIRSKNENSEIRVGLRGTRTRKEDEPVLVCSYHCAEICLKIHRDETSYAAGEPEIDRLFWNQQDTRGLHDAGREGRRR